MKAIQNITATEAAAPTMVGWYAIQGNNIAAYFVSNRLIIIIIVSIVVVVADDTCCCAAEMVVFVCFDFFFKDNTGIIISPLKT